MLSFGRAVAIGQHFPRGEPVTCEFVTFLKSVILIMKKS